MSNTTGTLAVRVARIEQVTPEIKRFTLVSPDGAPLPPFSGGSNLVVLIPHASGSYRNAYSLMSSPYNTSSYQIAVRRVATGRGGSRRLHDTIRQGDLLEVLRPVNLFPLSKHARLHLFIAGGVGITPVCSQLAELRLRGTPFEVHLAVRGAEHALLGEELRREYGDAIHLYHGDQGERLNIAAVLAGRPLGSDVYVCGPEGMIEDTVTAAHDHGWTDSHIHYERFLEQGSVGEAFSVTLARSGATVHVSPDQSLLEAAESAGHHIPYLCRGGACGMCETRVLDLDGELIHTDDWLSDADKSANKKIMPCVSRAKCARLVIDC
ncbi:oxidoreductase [Shimwellia pseudoproteus]|uniref:PDR/VanB family oxidoreductase n=1 Tax=Shimwellia pseudoproteus TaxID=570012 RepID=UPI0018EC3167|nr:PDR/VanB family oxidoreductase [Shimwellia pseudoproteus]MBJ3814699.1 oxidoreductase [Shimwellia pseudoproteus]